MITKYSNYDLERILRFLFPDGGWNIRDSEIVKFNVKDAEIPTKQELATAFAALAELTPEPAPVEIQKITLANRLNAMGKWGEFKRLLAQLPEFTRDSWEMATILRSDNPLFVEAAPMVKKGLGITDEQFKSLIVGEGVISEDKQGKIMTR